MKILVSISNVPDTTTKIRFTDDNTSLMHPGCNGSSIPGMSWH